MAKGPKDYINNHRVEYETPECLGSLCLEVLPFLKGKKWDEVALGYVHSLRPSCIRVTDGFYTDDAVNWRVTVHLSAGRIRSIEQEVEVGLPEGVVHGDALRCALKYGLKSKQVKWHQDATGYFYDGANEYKFTDKSKKPVPFPRSIFSRNKK